MLLRRRVWYWQIIELGSILIVDRVTPDWILQVMTAAENVVSWLRVKILYRWKRSSVCTVGSRQSSLKIALKNRIKKILRFQKPKLKPQIGRKRLILVLSTLLNFLLLIGRKTFTINPSKLQKTTYIRSGVFCFFKARFLYTQLSKANFSLSATFSGIFYVVRA